MGYGLGFAVLFACKYGKELWQGTLIFFKAGLSSQKVSELIILPTINWPKKYWPYHHFVLWSMMSQKRLLRPLMLWHFLRVPNDFKKLSFLFSYLFILIIFIYLSSKYFPRTVMSLGIPSFNQDGWADVTRKTRSSWFPIVWFIEKR